MQANQEVALRLWIKVRGECYPSLAVRYADATVGTLSDAYLAGGPDWREVTLGGKVPEGGVAIALAESCFTTGGVGLEVDIPRARGSRPSAWDVPAALFGESASRIVVSVGSQHLDAVMQAAASEAR